MKNVSIFRGGDAVLRRRPARSHYSSLALPSVRDGPLFIFVIIIVFILVFAPAGAERFRGPLAMTRRGRRALSSCRREDIARNPEAVVFVAFPFSVGSLTVGFREFLIRSRPEHFFPPSC